MSGSACPVRETCDCHIDRFLYEGGTPEVVYGVVEGSAGHCGWHRGGVACRGGVVADVGRPGRADRSPVGRTGPAGPVAGPRPGPGAGRPRGADRRRWRAIADIDVLRHQAELFGPVASDTTVWRCLDEIGGAQ